MWMLKTRNRLSLLDKFVQKLINEFPLRLRANTNDSPLVNAAFAAITHEKLLNGDSAMQKDLFSLICDTEPTLP